MQCTKIFEAGDDSVTSGKNKIGERCGSWHGSKKFGGLCKGHYNQLQKANGQMDDINAMRDKRAATIGAQKEEAAEKHEEIIKDIDKNPETYGINPTIIEAMGLNNPVDLTNELALYRQLPMGDGQDNYAEKMAYARWISTPEAKRTPKTTPEAAQILGISLQTIEIWRRSPEVATFRRRDAENMVENAFPLVSYKMIEGCDRGDPRFFKLYQEVLEKIRAKSPKNMFPSNLPPDLVALAEKRGKESGRAQMQGPLNDIEKSTVFAAVRDGNVATEELKN